METKRILEKIDKLDDRMDVMSEHMAVNNEQLKTHIKRTNILEEAVLPIKAKINQVIGAVKFLGFASVILAILTAIGLL